MSTPTTDITICMDSDIKTRAEAMYGELGIDLNTAINVFLRQSLRAGGFPFDVRIEQSQEPETHATEEFASDGMHIIHNASENRVQIIFDEKPDEDARCMLKAEGFRWSPRAGAWQRQLNDKGISAAQRIAARLVPQEPETLTPEEFSERYAK